MGERLEEGKDVSIVILTGCDWEIIRETCFAAGAVGVFQKPFDGDEVLAVIQRCLGETVTGA
jgi:DNA-binding response OmpR family regulator